MGDSWRQAFAVLGFLSPALVVAILALVLMPKKRAAAPSEPLTPEQRRMHP